MVKRALETDKAGKRGEYWVEWDGGSRQILNRMIREDLTE